LRSSAVGSGAGTEPRQQEPHSQQPPTPASTHECDSNSGDEADFDSDSEVKGPGTSLNHLPHVPRL
jgi:hypothetical protein